MGVVDKYYLMVNNELIYIDFEGRKDKQPTLVGFKYKNTFQQLTFNSSFSSEKIPERNRLECRNLKEFLREMISRDGRIVHFTQHEIKLFESNLEIKMEPERFLDAHKLVKNFIKKDKERYKKYKELTEWKKHTRRNKTRWTLKTMLKFSNYSIKEPYGKGKVTKWIGAVESGVKSPGDLTPVQKGNLTNLLRHNKTDVEGMEHLINWMND